MNRLKTITLQITEYPADNFYYTAIDTDGKRLSTRKLHRSCKGTTYIAAFVTKNKNHLYSYSIHTLWENFDRIGIHTIPPDKRCKPYAIAVVEEHKAAYVEWLKNKA